MIQITNETEQYNWNETELLLQMQFTLEGLLVEKSN